mmetsp:Transcript_68554/g.198593  ORF Transcript_68554/g.198593 Transcript_68554/m.198593 type:complete len:86 (+) Transcript_68554:445-702(+)
MFPYDTLSRSFSNENSYLHYKRNMMFGCKFWDNLPNRMKRLKWKLVLKIVYTLNSNTNAVSIISKIQFWGRFTFCWFVSKLNTWN